MKFRGLTVPVGERSAGFALLALALAAPHLFPHNMSQLTDLAVFVIIALAWDMLGGQMGYNSFGNVLFFGTGMYLCAITQVLVGGYDLTEYTSAMGGNLGSYALSAGDFLLGLGLGVLAAAGVGFVFALVAGSQFLQMRGHYFAIATLALGIAAGEIAGAIESIGAGSGMNFPQPPAAVPLYHVLYYLGVAIAVALFLFLRWLYATRFGFILNAIRDNEEKAEAMGLPTATIKSFAWALSGLALGAAGAIYGSGKNFIDPTEVAFSGATIGVWMILMAILGGKGTLWGPVIGAIVFHLFKEFFWTFLFGWQRVALGVLIVVIIVFFPGGIAGGVRKWTARFRKDLAGS